VGATNTVVNASTSAALIEYVSVFSEASFLTDTTVSPAGTASTLLHDTIIPRAANLTDGFLAIFPNLGGEWFIVCSGTLISQSRNQHQ
jgi:hypothetical protein